PPAFRWTRERVFEALAFAFLLAIACRVVFSGNAVPAYATTFLIVPFVVWVALRFTQREVTTSVAAVSALAVWYTVGHELGPFSAPPEDEALLLLLLFVSTVVFTGLMLSAVRGQLEEALLELRNRQRELELRVRERTAELEAANRRLQEDIASRARAERLLAESERRFRLMVESVVDYAIFMLDASGRVASWNAGAQRITGYSAEAIMGQHFSRFYPPDEVERRKPEWELEVARNEG